MDIRGREFFSDLVRVLEELKNSGTKVKVLFWKPPMRRWSAVSRRRDGSILWRETRYQYGSIRRERKLMNPVRKNADFIIDTTGLKPADLQNRLQNMLNEEKDGDTFFITVQSFGYKHGMSMDADMVFDVRFVPNPYYLKSMKQLTGNNRRVREYVMKFPESKEFVERVTELTECLIPYFIRQGKRSLVIAFGCTGGQHRSVAMANEFSEIFEKQGRKVSTVHRDILKR